MMTAKFLEKCRKAPPPPEPAPTEEQVRAMKKLSSVFGGPSGKTKNINQTVREWQSKSFKDRSKPNTSWVLIGGEKSIQINENDNEKQVKDGDCDDSKLHWESFHEPGRGSNLNSRISPTKYVRTCVQHG